MEGNIRKTCRKKQKNSLFKKIKVLYGKIKTILEWIKKTRVNKNEDS